MSSSVAFVLLCGPHEADLPLLVLEHSVWSCPSEKQLNSKSVSAKQIVLFVTFFFLSNIFFEIKIVR